EDVRGTYLPGYGVIFRIEPFRSLARIIISGNDSKSDSSGENITKEDIINKIADFLRDYGPTIHQLSGNDHIMVLFNGAEGTEFRIFGKSSSIHVYNLLD